MSEFKKLERATAEEVCQLYEPDAAAKEQLVAGIAPGEHLMRLVEGGLLRDAAQFLAYALPKREAVWWACLCARDYLPDDAEEATGAVLEAAEAWVMKPNEENRRAAWAKADEAEMKSAAAWAATGAFWSGESISPADSPAIVPPAENLTGVAVSGAVLLAAVSGEPQEIDERLKAFLKRGIDIAKGGTGR